ncbi:TetR/AcrR family transcriptional regulator [Gordonia sp. PDNC005]|uniref:TetR/AcrR family transcriptional regulator n=1 Tax=unclassified Gordonia (in: high G+C Gram-positive bacteria) TaxID=2657482 RepID=UPI001965BFCC|nr:TetR/AcrR family transcriptional regulator [Gordonia sp. PDNC005]QRY61985.1 TetR/AcrR family transcriptional regulator [Gordonia sp. PDNC005]
MTQNPDEAPATRWGDREQRRLDILRAGEALLVSGGFSALRMRDVAAGAGISLGAVYTYYSNKESLFIAVFADRLDRMMAGLEPAAATATDAAELFTVTTNMYREGYMVFGRQFDALSLVADVDAVQPEIADQLRDATARMVASLSSALIRLGYEGDVPAAMTLLWASMTGLANHFATERQEFLAMSWDEAVLFAADTLARGLGLPSRR